MIRKDIFVKIMRGILVREFGGPDVCKYETNINIPEPNEDQVFFLYCLMNKFLRLFY